MRLLNDGEGDWDGGKFALSKELTLMQAAASLEAGELVIVPTETVYGLAANALNAEAVDSIFLAKERPAIHPLIVHCRDIAQAQTLVMEWSDVAEKLANAFWPGPLSLVLPKSTLVPDIVTGGKDTVAIRLPNHQVFKSLLNLVAFPLAAPSANRFTKLSPTASDHLDPILVSRCAGFLDGGACEIGIESTVVSLVEGRPQLLRPGKVSKEEIETTLGMPVQNVENSLGLAPGQHIAHYRTRNPIILVDKVNAMSCGLTFGTPMSELQIQWSEIPEIAMRTIYDSLFRLDQMNMAQIEVEKPPTTSEWSAIWDRLSRAASFENS